LKKIKILIVDDSISVCTLLKKKLSKYEDIEVLDTAKDPYIAREKILKLEPDVITLDIEMPKMNGLQFTKILMKHYPMPIIIVSSFVKGNAELVMKALEIGAAEVVPKPLNLNDDLYFDDLHRKIVGASKAKCNFQKNSTTSATLENNIIDSNKIIAIGSSTGGTRALSKILPMFPKNTPPIVITQHMPAGYTKSFADRLNEICPNLYVKEAENNDTLEKNKVLIAPGNLHMLIKKIGISKYIVVLKDGPKVCYQKPSVDVMFNSVAKSVGRNSIGVILTGMGSDGADGLLNMKNNGAKTIGQNKETCVVYGMPKIAYEKGGVDFVNNLIDIPAKIIELI